MSNADETVGWRKAREEAVPEKDGLTLQVPGGGEIFLRKIPAGRFLMGARGENEDEEPATEQFVPEFYLGTFPVTQRQFRAWTESEDYQVWWKNNQELIDEDVREEHRNAFEGNDFSPAERVSWYEAEAFAEWLQEQEEFRVEMGKLGLDPDHWRLGLPGEVKWEYACRGDSRSEYSLGDGEEGLGRQGWFLDNSGRITHPVGAKVAGPHGLSETHGNVQEWVLDLYHENATREAIPGGVGRVRLDDPPAQSVPWWWRESERFFGRVLQGDRVVEESDQQVIGIWLALCKQQELENQTKVCERALVVRDGLAGEWPGEDSGLARDVFELVSQWIAAAEQGEDRVLRGGSWHNSASNCRSAFRDRFRPGNRYRFIGFRLGLFPESGEQEAGGSRQAAQPRREREGGTTDLASGGGGARRALSGASFPPRSGVGILADRGISEVVVSSKDGATWYEDRSWNEIPADETVVKVVLGSLSGGGEGASFGFALEDLQDLSAKFPKLRQLCLWGMDELREVGGLPESLERLEIRNCEGFVTMGMLPAALRSLDLGGCSSLARLPALPAGLEELYLDRCPGLEAARLAVLLEDHELGELIEVDGSETAAFENLKWLPKGVRRVRFRNCPKLTETGELARCGELEFLDLQGCAALTGLGTLPAGLAFLVVSGCESLKQFAGLGLSEPERGKEGANVAAHFLGLQKYGDEKRLWAAAKILLLGDGRVGKTTLAKRLQWEELAETERSDELRPNGEEDPTHAIQYFDWVTNFKIPDAERERIENSGIEVESKREGCLTGTAAIWDFGGQELYHQTHRLFAGSGSVFLIVWRDGEPDLHLVDNEVPDGERPEIWREMNRRRPLQYWLDYVYAIRPDAEVALICTKCPAGKARPDWKTQAPEFAKSEKAKSIKTFYVESYDDEHAQDDDFNDLREWLREAMGRMAGSLGLVKPKFFVEVAEEVGGHAASFPGRRRTGDSDLEVVGLGAVDGILV